MADHTAPNTGNYQIAKANVYFTRTGGARRHLGNVPVATFQMEPEKLDHFSSMAGIRKKDFSATVSVTATLTLTLEEINVENMRMALLGGVVGSDTEGLDSFHIGQVESVTGRVEIIQSNDVGPKWSYDFDNVTFTPSDAIPFIGDDFTGIQLEGDVLAVSDGSGGTKFGTATLLDSGT